MGHIMYVLCRRWYFAGVITTSVIYTLDSAYDWSWWVAIPVIVISTIAISGVMSHLARIYALAFILTYEKLAEERGRITVENGHPRIHRPRD